MDLTALHLLNLISEDDRLTELWSIMEFTSPGLLGPAEKFRHRFAMPIERNSDAPCAGSFLQRCHNAPAARLHGSGVQRVTPGTPSRSAADGTGRQNSVTDR
jgi:hypothetical protein